MFSASFAAIWATEPNIFVDGDASRGGESKHESGCTRGTVNANNWAAELARER
jgi:hypothetical protein